MAYLAQTNTVLAAIRATIEGELAWPFPDVNNGAAGPNPLSVLSNADCTYYGYAGGSHCILTLPKAMKVDYPYQCHLTPPHPAWHQRRSAGAPAINGGKVWYEGTYGVALVYRSTTGERGVLADLLNHADVLGLLLSKHTEGGVDGGGIQTAPTVVGSKVVSEGPVPSGFFIDERLGREWYCFGFDVWVRQEYNVKGGYVS